MCAASSVLGAASSLSCRKDSTDTHSISSSACNFSKVTGFVDGGLPTAGPVGPGSCKGGLYIAVGPSTAKSVWISTSARTLPECVEIWSAHCYCVEDWRCKRCFDIAGGLSTAKGDLTLSM